MKARWWVVIGVFAASSVGTVVTVARTPPSSRDVLEVTRDVAWFANHPVERNVVLKWCAADVSNARSSNCGNAFSSSLIPHKN